MREAETSWLPETAATLGEKVLGSKTNPREVGYSESHRIRPLQTLVVNVVKCMQLKHTEIGAHRLSVLQHQESVDMSRF